jgi:hypothetical protein
MLSSVVPSVRSLMFDASTSPVLTQSYMLVVARSLAVLTLRAVPSLLLRLSTLAFSVGHFQSGVCIGISDKGGTNDTRARS